MNFVAQLEEYLRDLGVESRKKHPGVKEASERAILKLRTLQNDYVIAVRKANNGQKHPDTSLFRSSDLLHPFLLAANYPNASPKLLDTSFKAMKTLMEANAICPGDGMNMVRVWMIQAQVVVNNSTKDSGGANAASAASSGDSTGGAQSSSGWLGGLLSSPITERTKTNAVTIGAVSSSHGGAGSGRISAKDLEKLALDILSCLLQLLELKDLAVSTEQWVQSVTLCCLLYLPTRQNVRQAAHSTLPQVLSLLVKDEKAKDLALETWYDLLGGAISSDSGSDSKQKFKGAFKSCKFGDKDSPQPPSSALSIELMTTLLKEAPHLVSDVGEKTLQITIELLRIQSASKDTSPLAFSKGVQFAIVVLQTQAKTWPKQCRDLVARLIQPIPAATEALRKQADFEDGYVYSTADKNLSAPTGNLETLQGLPPGSLWKSALSLEGLHGAVQDERVRDLLLHPDVVVNLLEATSDFCTIGASCREHIHLFILASRKKELGLSYAAEALPSISPWKSGKGRDENYIIGDALWIGLNLLLNIVERLDSITLDTCFAPSLSVLQHYLKRLPASGTIVKRSLEGYYFLAKICLQKPLLRRVLLSSLCKLSLPKWGTQDPSCELKDNNIAALVCLLNVVHAFHDDIGSDWAVVLQTFDELSNVWIASPHLSDKTYVGALSISAVYSRFSQFSTCFSDESLIEFIKGLRSVVIIEEKARASGKSIRKVDTSRIASRSNKDAVGKDEKGGIGEKLMTIGVRAIYGGNEDGSQPADDVPLTERTKNTYYHDYQLEFAKRMGDSKYPFRHEMLPFCCSLLADVAMANRFRHNRVAGSLLTELCATASESELTSAFAMDVVSMLIMSHLSQSEDLPMSFAGPGKIVYEVPRPNQFLAVEQTSDPDASGLSEISQLDLVGPLCDLICSAEDADVTTCCMESLHSILESSGHVLAPDAWKKVIQAVASVSTSSRSSSDWSECFPLGFRCLKLIVDDFLEDMDSASHVREALLDCCWSFGISSQDMNTSLTSIGLLWTIADQDAGTSSIDRALEKLVNLSSDPRAEVRNCAVNTLFSCIAGCGQTFSATQWQACICNMVFVVYDCVMDQITMDGKGPDEKQGKGETGRYRVSVHHSRDSAGKQWMATQAIVLGGLSRLLRSFFLDLLDTTSNDSAGNEPPWFEKAWNRILSYAFDTSTLSGGRDTIPVRSAGVQLLVICNQLACKAGIQAAITPARVGTNMQVVNGALRSTRDATTTMADAQRAPLSEMAETWRENLFLDAFDVLDSFRVYLESDVSAGSDSESSGYMEPAQAQVLGHFANDLKKLYECCKDHEFAEGHKVDHDALLQKVLVLEQPQPSDEDALETRFVRIVTTVCYNSSGGPQSRFLSQAQRACLELLKSMASNGSLEAFVCLSSLCFDGFIRQEVDNNRVSGEIAVLTSTEASNSLFSALPNDCVSDEIRVMVLCRMMLAFVGEQNQSYSVLESGNGFLYRLFKSMIGPCVTSAYTLQKQYWTLEQQGSPMDQLLDLLWDRLCAVVARLLASAFQNELSAQVFNDLTVIVDGISKYPNDRYSPALCGVLATEAMNCLDLDLPPPPPSEEEKSDEKDYSNESLKLFGSCFGGICRLNPEEKILPVIAKQVLLAAKEELSKELEDDDNDDSANADDRTTRKVEACVIMCQSMEDTLGMELVVISVFPLLCEMVGASDHRLRDSVATVLSKVNVGHALDGIKGQCQAAEDRAQRAEEQMATLRKEMEDLQKENEALQRQLAFIS
ncbi:unnamed protein product [Cylindrotheca closterium]|uniref:Protein MON2 homolog n=1 Tax=Cylindrotheca closterium TaxID=2856 RepID=A0AAD2FT73_9STRA|nr:unnamed protein product [Cylindrotheca closterium]